MVGQYPHNLIVVDIPDSTFDEETGNYIPADPLGVLPFSPCRAEANSEGRKFSNADGEAYIYQFTVYLPSTAGNITAGTNVKIQDDETEIFSGTVKRFLRGQINCRLWV